MKRRLRSQRLVAEINITPLTDVILVLLIIFMVATPLVFQSSIKISLPKSKTIEEPPLELTISIDASGKAFLENKQYSLNLDLELLKFELTSRLKGKKNATLLIRGDKEVQYDFVIKVMDLATGLGVKNIVLLTELRR